MKLLRAEPREGIVWIRRAFQVFVQQPFGLSGLVAVFATLLLLLSSIPLMNLVAPIIVPSASLVFMIAASRAEAGERPLPGAFATFFAMGRPRLIELLKLGAAYLVASVIVVLVLSLFDGDASPLKDAMPSAPPGPAESASAGSSAPDGMPAAPPDLGTLLRVLFKTMLQFGVALIVLSVPFWHAPALVFWGRQSWAKSLFFSTLAIWRNRGAFAVYGLAWFGIVAAFVMAYRVFAPLLMTSGKPSMIGGLVFMSAMWLFVTLLYTGIWFTVSGCFAIDDADLPPSPPKETPP